MQSYRFFLDFGKEHAFWPNVLTLCKTIALLFPVQITAPEIFACFLHYYVREEQQAEKVRYGHQRIKYVGKVPNDVEADHRS